MNDVLETNLNEFVTPWIDDEPSEFQRWKAQFPDEMQVKIEAHYQWLARWHRPKLRKKYFGFSETLTTTQLTKLDDYVRHQVEVDSVAVLRLMIWRTCTNTVKQEVFEWSILQKQFEVDEPPFGLGRSVGFVSSVFSRYPELRAYLEYAPLTGRNRLRERHDKVLDKVGDIALDDTHPKQMDAIKEVNKIVGAYEPQEVVIVDKRDWRAALPQKVIDGNQ